MFDNGPTSPTQLTPAAPPTPPTPQRNTRTSYPLQNADKGSPSSSTTKAHTTTTQSSTSSTTPFPPTKISTHQPQPPPEMSPSHLPPPDLTESESEFNRRLIHQLQLRRRPSIFNPLESTQQKQTSSATSEDRVNQSLQRPVTWNDEHFEAFLQKTPPADATCEVCHEKIIALENVDVEYLINAFKCLDTTNTGYVTSDEMTQVLMQWINKQSGTDQSTFELDHLKTLVDVEADERVNFSIFLKKLKDLHCCQTLCVCRPPRWLHNTCLNEKLSLGLFAKHWFLLRCGYCRESVWGKSYVEWSSEATQILHKIGQAKQESLDDAYELAMDVVGAVIRCGGGGVKRNVILGDSLSVAAIAIYNQQVTSNGGVPIDHLSGQICAMALRMGAPPTPRIAWILSEMRWNFDYTLREDGRNEEEQREDLKRKKDWLDLAMKCCRLSKRYIPKEDTAQQMRTECMLIEIKVHYQDVTIQDVLTQVKAWPWGLEEMTVYSLYAVCSVLAENNGVAEIKPFLECGERLIAENPDAEDPELFSELRAEYNVQSN